MKLSSINADIYVPDAVAFEPALARTTHLAVCAHQDDIEILAYHGIAACFGQADRWFTGIVVTNGAGSPRAGIYANYTDDQMQKVRIIEQRKAAYVGEYGCQLQLGYPSAAVKDPKAPEVVGDLLAILQVARPDVVYLHNLADKHDTHIGVALRSIAAIRKLPAQDRPKKVYGCEVWRDLDWLSDDVKVTLPVSERENIAASLVGVFDSQITGGKRYDLATAGRRLANATYYASHATDQATAITNAMDLTPLIEDVTLDPIAYTLGYIERFREDVQSRIKKFS